MEPYNQPPAPTPEQDPYHFILNSQNVQKKSTSPNNNSLKTRILFAIGIGAVLITAIILFSTFVIGGSNENAGSLVTLAAHQQEVIRVSDITLKDATDSTTKAYAETVKLSVTTQSIELNAYFKKNDQEVTPIQLAAKKNTQTDTTLAAALKSNRFDDAAITSLKAHLTDYRSELDTSYRATESTTAKALLKKAFDSTVLLLK